MRGNLLFSLSLSVALAAIGCSSGGGQNGACGTCPTGETCNAVTKTCVKGTGNADMAFDMANPPTWPQTGDDLSQLWWHLTNTDTTSGGPFSAAIATDKSNNLVLAGGYQGKFDATGGDDKADLTSAGMRDIWLAAYDVNLNFKWAKSFGGTGDDWATSVVADSQGNFFVTGFAAKGTDIMGGGSGAPDSVGDVFVAQFSSTGAPKWVQYIRMATLQVGNTTESDFNVIPQVATDGTNVYLLTAYSQFNLSGAGSGLPSAGLTTPVALAGLTNSGTYIWQLGLGDLNPGKNIFLAADSTGITVAGDAYSSTGINLGGGALTSATPGMFIGRLNSPSSATPSYGWGKAYAGLTVAALNIDSASGPLVGGGLGTSGATVGATTLTNSQGSENGFIAKFDKTGAASFAETFVSSEQSSITAVTTATDGSNDVALTGDFFNNVNLGGTARKGFSNAALVAGYTSAGTYIADNFLTSHLSSNYGAGIAPMSDGTFIVLVNSVEGGQAAPTQGLGFFKVSIHK